MKSLDDLNPREKNLLLKFPVYVSMLAAEKNFEKNINDLDNTLPVDKAEREEIITNELAQIEKILLKLGTDYALVMHRSMRSFKNHVSRAHRNILEYFVFPLPINGITD